MTISLNGNPSALAILQALSGVASDLTTAEGRTASGTAVAVPADNPAVYSAASVQTGEIASLGVVADGLNRAQSVADMALSAGQAISDLLAQMKAKALSASDPTADPQSRQAFQSDFQSLAGRLAAVVSTASYGGVNLLNGSRTGGVAFAATADGQGFVTLTPQNLSLGGPLISFTAAATLATQTQAAAVLGQVETALGQVNTAVADLGVQASQISNHASFVSTLKDALTTGVGSLVDADIASESARLTALQAQQQLATASLSIANQQPSVILSLLR